MDLMTIIGLVGGAATIYYVMAAGGILHMLFDPIAAVLVFGGTISSTMIAYPWKVIRQTPKALRFVFFPPRHAEEDMLEIVNTLTAMAEKAKRQSIESLEEDIPGLKNSFLVQGTQMLVDGLEREVVKDHLEKEILYARQRQAKLAGVFRTMATLAPIFGLLGTLIGVVQVLRNLSDPTSMGKSMAIAITTTFYGIFAANFIFLPVAIKLNEQTEHEIMGRELIAEGILAIHEGAIPMLVKKRLTAFLSSKERAKTSGDRSK